MEALRNNPRFAELRQAVMQNPALLQGLIQQLSATNPALAEHLGQDPGMLLQLLGGMAGGGGGDFDEEGDGPLPPGTQVLQVTPEERAAIERVRQ